MDFKSELQALLDKYNVQFVGKIITLNPSVEEVSLKPVLPTVSADAPSAPAV